MAARTPTAWRRLKYRVLQNLPGRRGLHYREKYRAAMAPLSEAAFDRALAEAAGKIGIDLGANVGTYSRRLARHCAHVYAFEPDPWTAETLRERTADLPNVTVIEAAAGTEEGAITLYRRGGFDEDREKLSLSASTIADKRNIDRDAGMDVRLCDFPAFLAGLEQEVAILKIDIEGAEVELLEALFDDPAFARVGHVFVETHESRIPDLAARTETLRRRAKTITQPVIDMNWR